MCRLAFILLGLLLLVPATSQAKLKVRGGERQSVVTCGKQRSAKVVGQGERVIVGLRRKAKLRYQRCVDGEWKRGRTSRKGGNERRLRTGRHSDLRLRSRGMTRFVRVGDGPVSELPVTFSVVNGDQTAVGCPEDGATYTVRGHLTGRAAALDADGPVDSTLYTQGHSFAEFLWRYEGVPGYDFVEKLAREGHISVTYDRLGYESSDKPNGYESCYGTEATVVNQMIMKLKSGDYTVDGHAPLSFDRVALAGHSQGAIFSNLATSTFGSPDALLYFSFFESGVTPALGVKYQMNLDDCANNPSNANQEPGNPTGYAFRGRTDEDFISTNFADAEPQVIADFTAMRNVDPCGFPYTALETVSTTNGLAGTIDVPVLVVLGAQDPNFAPAAHVFQGAVFSGSTDVTAESIPGAGHALMLERQAPLFQNLVEGWLSGRGF